MASAELPLLRGRLGCPLTEVGGKGEIPALGGHTRTPLHAVGMTDDGIAALLRDGVAA